jgi:hypothetical protein
MPYEIRKVRGKRCYSVKKKTKTKTKSKRVFAKCTTLKKAKAQVRLLHRINRMSETK